MRRRSTILAAIGVTLAVSGCGATDTAVPVDATRFVGATAEVVRTATCECCGEHVDYMADAGFEVKETVVDSDELQALRAGLDLPSELQSCHTTFVERPTRIVAEHLELSDRALVEGHAPVADIDAAIDAEVDGVLVPGMPPGAPGMPGAAQGPLPVHHLDGGVAAPVAPAGPAG